MKVLTRVPGIQTYGCNSRRASMGCGNILSFSFHQLFNFLVSYFFFALVVAVLLFNLLFFSAFFFPSYFLKSHFCQIGDFMVVSYCLLLNWLLQLDLKFLISACPVLRSTPRVIILHGDHEDRIETEAKNIWPHGANLFIHKPPLPLFGE